MDLEIVVNSDSMQLLTLLVTQTIDYTFTADPHTFKSLTIDALVTQCTTVNTPLYLLCEDCILARLANTD